MKLGIATTLLVLIAGVVSATSGPFDTYVSATTAVVKEAGQQPILDDGGTICNKGNPNPSLGGGCVLFGPWDSIHVSDSALGDNVAFQVCIDNNGDSVCGGGNFGPTGQCFDEIFFSHDDAGNFYNPLGPLPQSFRFGCTGGPWPGYVVMLCSGVHNAGLAHAHSTTTGSITGTSGGTGFGDFCNPGESAPPKPYFVL